MTTGIMQMIMTVLGCVAVFIFAVGMMSEGLQKTAGDRIKRIIDMFTANYFIAVVAGFLMSAIFQSSSACIVLIIGFVNARLIRLPEALCVILGANIGTTLTAHIVAFNVGEYGWAAVFAGFVTMFVLKENEKIKNIGEILFGAGLIFVSLNMMSDTMSGLIESQWFKDVVKDGTANPVTGIFAGMIATALVQSSSAVVAVLQQFAEALALGGHVEVVNFLPIVFGCNIGTTLTGLLASIRCRLDSKRAAVFHLIFNIFTSVVCIAVLALLVHYDVNIPTITDNSDMARALANAHTVFNILGVILIFPFVGRIVALLKRIVISKEKDAGEVEFLYIQKQNKLQPVIAHMMCLQELMRCSKMVVEMFLDTKRYFVGGNEKVRKSIEERYGITCALIDKIVDYISETLASEGSSQKRKYQIQMFFEMAEYIKSIGKNCINICNITKTQLDEYIELAEEDESDIIMCFDTLSSFTIQAFEAVEEDDAIMAKKNLQRRDEIGNMISSFRRGNIERVRDNRCDSSGLIIFSDILDNMDRIAAECRSISEVVLNGNRM